MSPLFLSDNPAIILWIVLASALLFLIVAGLIIFFLAKASEKKKARTVIKIGTPRIEAEKALGAPIQESKTPEGNAFCVYEQGGGFYLNIEYGPDGLAKDISTSSEGLPNS